MTPEALLDAMRESPEDDALRLILADWLEDNGQPERAEFIRIQVERSRADPVRSDHELSEREEEIRALHQRAWVGEVPQGISFGFRRGLLRLTLWDGQAKLEDLPEGLLDCLRQGWVWRLEASPDAATLPAFLASLLLSRVTQLSLQGTGVDGGGGLLASCPHLSRLRGLVLSHTTLGDQGASALASSPHLSRLTALSLVGCYFGVEGLRALAGSATLSGLKSLIVNGASVGDAGALALAWSPALRSLARLDLPDCGLTSAGVQTLAGSAVLGGLTSLDLSFNALGDGVDALASSPHLRGLRKLVVGHCEVGRAGARALASSPLLAGLEVLDLGGNPCARDVPDDCRRDPAFWRRLLGVQGLGEGPPSAEAVEALVGDLKEDNAALRRSAVRSLRALWGSAPAPRPAALEQALLGALCAGDEVVREEAHEALGFGVGDLSRGALPALRAALRDERPDVRRHVATLLTSVEPPGGTRSLLFHLSWLECLGGQQWGARALDSLLARRPEEARVLAEAFAEDPTGHRLAAGALIQEDPPSPDVLGLLRRLLVDLTPEDAFWLAGRIGVVPAPYPERVAALEGGLVSPAPEVRAAAARALGRLGRAEVGPSLTALLADPDERVRWSAAAALRTLGLEVPAADGSGELTAEVVRLLDAGRKVEALQAYRKATGAGLVDARDAVEEIRRRLRP
jgi:uncharacterized protein (TIGR02996 family)